MKVAVSISYKNKNNQEIIFPWLAYIKLLAVVEMRENNHPFSGQKPNQTNMASPQQSKYSNLPNTYTEYGHQHPYQLGYPYPYYQHQNYQPQNMPHPNFQYYNPCYPQYSQPAQQQYIQDPPKSHPHWQRNPQHHHQQKFDKTNTRQKPFDPRRRNNNANNTLPQKKPIKFVEHDKEIKKQKLLVEKNQKNNENSAENQSYASDSQKQSESQDQQILYQKSKAIVKKRDPVLDSPSQIKKWVEARKRNYPVYGRPKAELNGIQGQMSILESKIRKKIMFVTSDGRGLMKKLKNMHILKRLVGQSQSDFNKNRPKKLNQQKIKQIKEGKRKERIEQLAQQKKKSIVEKVEMDEQNSENQQAPIQKPIAKVTFDQSTQQLTKIKTTQQVENCNTKIKGGLTPEDMISHLKQKQKEDKEFFDQLLNYRTNSLNYKYSSQTLQTNFVLEDIFEESSYLLQIIRHIVKNDFFTSN